MNTPVRLTAFGAGLAAVFLAAAAAGNAAGPLDVGGEDHPGEHAGTASTAGPGVDHGAGPESTHDDAAGTTGVRLVPAQDRAVAGAPIHYRFTIDGAGGPITAFDELHERRLHLIVVSDDLVDFWHVHPEMSTDGTWHVDLPALEARVYSLYADVHPTGGEQVTVRSRLTVTAGEAGPVSPRPLPAAATSTEVAGVEVSLSGTPAIGESTLRFDVSRDGAAVRTEPYLGAAGHLVAIRTSDLAYLHVHPLDGPGPEISFAAALPSAGTYRLFLDIALDGEVHTAAFTVEVPAGAPASTEAAAHGAHDG